MFKQIAVAAKKPMRCADSKAAEGRRTPRRWRVGQDPRKREASWSAPALWRFGPSLVLLTNVRIPNSTGRRPLRFLVYGCFIRSCRPMSLKALAKVATSVTRLSGRHLSGNKRFLAVFSGMRWWGFPFLWFAFPIPTGLYPSALGCEERATQGNWNGNRNPEKG